MNVQLENLPNCITTMRVELPAEKVTEAWDAVAKDYLQFARIPGYRPGKAPRAVVEGKFKKEIREQVEKKLITDSCREAIVEQKLKVLSLADIQGVELGQDKTLRYTATLVTAPAFELPDYQSLSVTVPSLEVTEQDIDEAIERLRDQAADFPEVTGRPAQMEDFVVIDYTGTLDGVPVHEALPAAGKPLSENTDFWVKMTPESFLPGFCEALLGAQPGDNREFDVDVPADFPVPDLQGKKLHYNVTVKALKEKVLPALDDEWADKTVPGKTLAEMREIARTELTRHKTQETEGSKRNQIMLGLVAKVECELPEGMLATETRRILEEIIRENQSRGVPDEMIKENVNELLASAGESARQRLKGTFIAQRIAEAEKITVSKQELDQRIGALAARYQITSEKLRQQMDEAGTLDRLHEDILTGKVLDFLSSAATVTYSEPEPVQADE